MTADELAKLCDFIETLRGGRFDGFGPGADKDAIEAEMRRRGYEVIWHRNDLKFLLAKQPIPEDPRQDMAFYKPKD